MIFKVTKNAKLDEQIKAFCFELWFHKLCVAAVVKSDNCSFAAMRVIPDTFIDRDITDKELNTAIEIARTTFGDFLILASR